MIFIPTQRVAFFIFNYPVYWYGLIFLSGAIAAYYTIKHYLKRYIKQYILVSELERIFYYLFAGSIIGGRVFYILLYDLQLFFSSPMSLIFSRLQGMSFHGGIIGIAVAIYIYSKLFHNKHKAKFIWNMLDLIGIAGPVAMLIGRIGNFINQEHMGRVIEFPDNIPWAVVFQSDELQMARHPSQLYESLIEGALCFLIMAITQNKFKLLNHKRGILLFLSITLQAAARIICEQFRIPDGYLFAVPLGVIYSLPLLMLGITGLTWRVFNKNNIIS